MQEGTVSAKMHYIQDCKFIQHWSIRVFLWRSEKW